MLLACRMAVAFSGKQIRSDRHNRQHLKEKNENDLNENTMQVKGCVHIKVHVHNRGNHGYLQFFYFVCFNFFSRFGAFLRSHSFEGIANALVHLCKCICLIVCSYLINCIYHVDLNVVLCSFSVEWSKPPKYLGLFSLWKS